MMDLKNFVRISTFWLLCSTAFSAGVSLVAAPEPSSANFPNRILTRTEQLAGTDIPSGTSGPVLIQLWASWCTRCSTMFGELDQFAKDYPGLPVIALSIDEDEKAARDYLARHTATLGKTSAISYRHDRTGEIAKRFQVNAVPTVLLVDRDGSILTRSSGHIKKSELLKIAHKLTP